ncbi:MAG: type II secretion system protein M [Pseudomonadaceae bacterium]|nr:MAG: type II secretion system protein M [Pseudomonadaceae bacterium]
MNAWWSGLAPRERIIVIAGLVVLAVLVSWLWVWEPLTSKRSNLQAEVSRLSTDVAWMQQQADQVRRRANMQRGSQTRESNGSVLTLVEVSANAAGIRQPLERVQPESEGARLWFDGVGFDALVGWLGELERRHGLQVSQLAVDVNGEPGKVSARVLVEPQP